MGITDNIGNHPLTHANSDTSVYESGSIFPNSQLQYLIREQFFE